MEESQFSRKNKYRAKQRKNKKKIFTICILLLALFTFIGERYISNKLSNAKNTAQKIYSSGDTQKLRNVSQILKDNKPVSILLMGTDTGSLGRTFRGRTDTMIVCVLNPHQKKMTLISIPRDEEVDISGYEQYSPAKINAAYFYGGSKAAVETVQKDLDIPIDFYATINMGGLEELINNIGGLDIKPISSFSYGGYTFKKDELTHMSGKKALQYCRMRYDDPLGDYGRQMRQRQVLMKLAFKASKLTSLVNQKFTNSLSGKLTTDLTFDDLITLGTKYRVATHGMQSDHLQGQSQMIDGQAFEVVSSSEKQRVTDLIRKALDIEPVQNDNSDNS